MKLYIKTLFVFLFFSLIFLPKNIEARSGCCSHHGGVCGCGCCDGTDLSATCAPYYPECNRPPPTRIPTRIIPTNVPTSKPIPTLKPKIIVPTKVPPTRKPTPTIKPTLIPTIIPTSVLPTEVISPTKPAISNKSNLIETKTVKQKNTFSSFFSWLFNKK